MNSSASTTGDRVPEEFYDLFPVESNLIYQGEVLVDVPFFSSEKPKTWLLLRTQSGKQLNEALKHGGVGGKVNVLDANQSAAQWDSNKLGDFAVARLDKRPVLVLTQTCDIEQKAFIQIAPIYQVPPEDAAYLERLKNSAIFSAFWLPPRTPEIESASYADLELIQAVHKSYVKRITANQHFRLRPARIRELQRAITRYFGRPNSFDSRSDHAPTNGNYLCVQCFFRDGRATPVELSEGSAFPICETCHGMQWVLRDP